jgi:hypothetical protein
LQEIHWSEAVSRLSVWLSGLTDFASAAEILERVGGIHTSSGSTWQRMQKWGEAYRQAERKEQTSAQTVELRQGIVPGERREAQRMGVGMDGFLIHLRQEGWKEVKLGCVFEVGQKTVLDEQTHEEVTVGRAVGNTYVAHLGGPEAFGQRVWAEAKRRGWTRAADTQVLGDGAVWIWNLAGEHFYDSQQVVDWYHAKQHLALAGQLLYGEDPPAYHRWLADQATRLYEGHAEEIAAGLSRAGQRHPAVQEALATEAGYFEHNQHRMDYLEMRIQGWVIGSGMVESGAKQYKQRLAGPGMQWSREGAERILPVRSAILSGRFDQIWQTVYNSPQN